MKRELAAGALLLLLMAGAWWNIRAVDTLTGDILAGLDISQAAEEQGDHLTAQAALDKALNRWLEAMRRSTPLPTPFMSCRHSCSPARGTAAPPMTSCATIWTASSGWSTPAWAVFYNYLSLSSLVSSSMKVLMSLKLR